jgi:hypothetical protein
VANMITFSVAELLATSPKFPALFRPANAPPNRHILASRR